MIEIRCHTDRYGIMSKTIDGTAWFEQASAEDIHDFLDGGWQGNTSSSFSAFDFLEFFKGDELSAINAHLEANSGEDIALLLDVVDPEQTVAWLETYHPEAADLLNQNQRSSFSYA